LTQYASAQQSFFANANANLLEEMIALVEEKYQKEILFEKVNSFVCTYLNAYNSDITWNFFVFEAENS